MAHHHEVPEPAGETRTETDTFGPIKVPAGVYYGAQTARSMFHFNIGLPTGRVTDANGSRSYSTAVLLLSSVQIECRCH